jgi:Protein of unknown function (DUF3501)
MKPLTPAELLDAEAYRLARPRFEQQIIAAKAARRLTVGDTYTFLFENRDTLRWQVQEMCRVEQIVDPAAIQHELDTYNALLPREDSLSATLLIEVVDPAVRDGLLQRLVGLHERVSLRLEGGPPARATFDAEQFDARRVSSVQFVRFPLDAAQRSALANLNTVAELVIDHPAHPASARLPASLRAALIDDAAE